MGTGSVCPRLLQEQASPRPAGGQRCSVTPAGAARVLRGAEALSGRFFLLVPQGRVVGCPCQQSRAPGRGHKGPMSGLPGQLQSQGQLLTMVTNALKGLTGGCGGWLSSGSHYSHFLLPYSVAAPRPGSAPVCPGLPSREAGGPGLVRSSSSGVL